MSLKKKLVLVSFVCVLLILTVVGRQLYVELRGAHEATVRHQIEIELRMLDFSLTTMVVDVEGDVWALAENPLVRTRDDAGFTSFLQAEEDTFEYDIGATEQSIIEVFDAYRTSHRFVNSVYMGRENGSFVRSHPRARPTQYDPRRRPWYQLGRERKGEVARTAPYRSVTTDDVNIGFVRALTYEQGDVFGVVGADVTLADLTTFIEQIRISFDGSMFLADDRGTLLASREATWRFEPVSAVFGQEFADWLAGLERFGVFEDVAGDRRFFSYRSPELGWYVGAFLSTENIATSARAAAARTLVPILLTIVALALLMLVIFHLVLLRPIIRLHGGVLAVARSGVIEQRFPVSTRDEIGDLERAFNDLLDTVQQQNGQLVEQMERLTKEIADKQAAQRELVDREEQIRRLTKLDALGQLAAGIAHDFNNLLGGIVAGVGLLERTQSTDRAFAERVAIIRTAADQAAELVRRLQSLSPRRQARVSFSAHKCIEDAVSILDSTVAGAIDVSVELDARADHLVGDPAELTNAILNLGVNARDAMPGGGSFRVETSTTLLDESACDASPFDLEPGPYLGIRVIDSGPGMPSEVLERVFEPFFTTKPSGCGTGLGLANVYAMVKAHGGSVEVDSEPGRGTTFSILLPLDPAKQTT